MISTGSMCQVQPALPPPPRPHHHGVGTGVLSGNRGLHSQCGCFMSSTLSPLPGHVRSSQQSSLLFLGTFHHLVRTEQQVPFSSSLRAARPAGGGMALPPGRPHSMMGVAELGSGSPPPAALSSLPSSSCLLMTKPGLQAVCLCVSLASG